MAPRDKQSAPTEVEEKVGLQHRVSLGIVSLTLGVVCLSLAVALFLAPSGLAPKLFLLTPGKISVTASTSSAVTLTWTAPGDDGNIGTATSYDIRYSTAPITADNFSSATQVTDEPVPQPASSTEIFTVNNLNPGTTYFFALKATDEAGNTSLLSNIASKTTTSIAQSCVPVYSCSDWSACVRKQQTRTCTVTNGCPAGLDQPATTQSCSATGGKKSRVSRHLLTVGTGTGVNATVRILDTANSKLKKEFKPFTGVNKNSFKLAGGDIDGDQVADLLVATAAPSNPLVRLFTENGTYRTQFNPYPALKKTGVSIATGDVDGDGVDEVITVPDKAAGQVRVWSYAADTKKFTMKSQFQLFPKNYRGGFSVASEDLDLDGNFEVILAPKTSSSGVYIYSIVGASAKRVAAWKAYPIAFRTGLLLAAGDINGDGRPEVITSPGAGYYSDVKTFSMSGKMVAHFLPASTAFFGGVDLTAFDVNEDGRDEILTVTYSRGVSGLRIFRYDGGDKRFERIRNTQVFPSTMRLGARVGGI